MKRLQNRIAEAGATLPTMAAAALVVWLLCGLIEHRLWPHLAYFTAAVYLMVEMSNQNALLRVRSRMVTSTFIALSCAACFMLADLAAGLAQLCMVCALTFLFQTYQDEQAAGRTFYGFAAVGVATLAQVHVLWIVPVLWVMMATHLLSMSARTLIASVIGLLAPYWVVMLWLLSPFAPDGTTGGIDLSLLGQHFAQIAETRLQLPDLSLAQWLVTALTVTLAAVGIWHFWQQGYEDRIRTRLLFGMLTTMTVTTLLLALVLSQHFTVFMRMAFVFVSPLVAHLFMFTSTRASSIAFFSAIAAAVGMTVYGICV